MFEAVASLSGYLMNFIYSLVQNYGVAIIIFTLLIKLILLPFTIKQQKSLEEAQELQPIIQELQRKYGNDQQKFAEEYQKLLKSRNTSMMSSMGCSGCLINLIQLPILLGMFYMLVNPLTHIVKIDEDKINEYKNEINTQRMNAAVASIKAKSDEYTDVELEEMLEKARKASYVDSRYYEIDIIKDHELLNISDEEKEKLDIDMEFFGINLCDVAANNTANKLLLIIPVLSTLFTYLSLWISTYFNKKKGIKTPKPEDSEIPMPDMRVMNIMMPVMIGYAAYAIPQGVGLYWATSNMLGVIQLVALKLVFDKDLFKKKEPLNNIKYTVVDDKKDNKKKENSINKVSEKSEDYETCTDLTVIKKNNNKKNNKNKKKSKNKKKK